MKYAGLVVFRLMADEDVRCLFVAELLDRLRQMRDDKAPIDDLINELEEEIL